VNIDDVEYLPPTRLGADATTATTGFFSSPEDLLTAAKQTDDYVSSMQQAVDAVTDWKGRGAPSGSGTAFRNFYTNWKNFYANNFSSRASVIAHFLTTNMQGTLVNYQNQAADWGKKLKKWNLDVPAAPTPGADGGAKSTMMWVGIAAVSIVGLFIIGKLVHTVAFGSAALEEAEDEALKIAEAKKRKKHDKTVLSIT
jgi:hypothetical protein